MLKNDTRKVYIVSNIKSDTIEQVIFILRSGNLQNKSKKFSKGSDIALEAQTIIDNYALEIENATGKNSYINKKRRKAKRKNMLYKFLTGAAITSMVAFLLLGFLSKYI